jgi:hypothetical protein
MPTGMRAPRALSEIAARVSIAALLTGLVPALAVAGSEDAVIHVRKAGGSELRPDSPLELRGLLEARPIELAGVLKVKVSRSSESGPGSYPLRIEVPNGSLADIGVSPEQVTLSPASLPPNAETNVTLRVGGVGFPGVYEAPLELAADGVSNPVNVPTRLLVYLKPTISVDRQELTAQWVDCSGSCWLAGLLFPGGVDHRIRMRVSNASPAGVCVYARAALVGGRPDAILDLDANARPLGVDESDAVFALGTQTGTVTACGSAASSTGPARGAGAASAGTLPAGTYAGTAVFRADPLGAPGMWKSRNGDTFTIATRQKVPVSLKISVRAGPWLPLILILLGIVVGRLLLGVGRAGAKLKIALYPRLVALESAVARVRHSASRRTMERAVRRLRTDITRATQTEEQLRTTLFQLADRVQLLIDLDGLSDDLQRSQLQAADKARLENDIDGARDLVSSGGDVAQARAKVGAVEREIDTAISGPTRTALTAAPDVALVAAQETTQAIASGLDRLEAATASAKKPLGRARLRAAQLLSIASGTGEAASLEALYWLWRPLLFIVLLTALTFQGLLLLYAADAHADFGARGLADYFPLVLWGLGTDVANRTLQEITLPGGPSR